MEKQKQKGDTNISNLFISQLNCDTYRGFLAKDVHGNLLQSKVSKHLVTILGCIKYIQGRFAAGFDSM